jgi:hypothetical protein
MTCFGYSKVLTLLLFNLDCYSTYFPWFLPVGNALQDDLFSVGNMGGKVKGVGNPKKNKSGNNSSRAGGILNLLALPWLGSAMMYLTNCHVLLSR